MLLAATSTSFLIYFGKSTKKIGKINDFGFQLGRQNGTENHPKTMLKANMFADSFFEVFSNFLGFLNPNFDVFLSIFGLEAKTSIL